jgi:steroid delta-isomerase-like uncharacterized protein
MIGAVKNFYSDETGAGRRRSARFDRRTIAMAEIHPNAAFIRHWFEEVWNKGRITAVDEMLAHDAKAYGLADSPLESFEGPNSFKPFVRRFREAFPDIRITVLDTICEGDKVAARCVVTGTHKGDSLGCKACGKAVEFAGITIVRIKDGKIIEGWNHYDFLSLRQQIGLL